MTPLFSYSSSHDLLKTFCFLRMTVMYLVICVFINLRSGVPEINFAVLTWAHLHRAWALQSLVVHFIDYPRDSAAATLHFEHLSLSGHGIALDNLISVSDKNYLPSFFVEYAQDGKRFTITHPLIGSVQHQR